MAGSIPIIPSLFGIVTLFTFFIIFPDKKTSTLLGIAPKILLAFAAAYDSAIGSVHPSAATISSSRILRTFSILVSILSPL